MTALAHPSLAVPRYSVAGPRTPEDRIKFWQDYYADKRVFRGGGGRYRPCAVRRLSDGRVFPSIRAAANDLGVSDTTIRNLAEKGEG